MYLIDQHAAEERVRYEYYSKIEPEVVVMPLLIPRPLELSKDEIKKLLNYRNELEQIGIKLNNNGELIAHPTFIKDEDLDIMIDIMLTMIEERNNIDIKTLLDDLTKDKSCKASVKANHNLSRREIDELIVSLRKTKNPFHWSTMRAVKWIFSFS